MSSGFFIDTNHMPFQVVDFDPNIHTCLKFTGQDDLYLFIDKSDSTFVKSHKWSFHKITYYFSLKRTPMHRILNKTPKDMVCDHLHGADNGLLRRLDNRRMNLFNCSPSQNNHNRIGSRDVRGVKIEGDKFLAMISRNYHSFRRTFDKIEDAIRFYDLAALKIYGVQAVTNNPREEYSQEEIGRFYIPDKFLNEIKVTDPVRKNKSSICLCGSPVFSKKFSLCKKHYSRFLGRKNKYGITIQDFIKDPKLNGGKSRFSYGEYKNTSLHRISKQNGSIEKINAVMGRVIIQGKTIIFDMEDAETIQSLKWRFSGNGYLMNRNSVTGATVYLWRLLLKDDESYTVRFEDEDKLNYRKDNLIALDKSGGAAISHNERAGISPLSDGRFRASVFFKKHGHYVGTYQTMEEAVAARREAKDFLHKDGGLDGFRLKYRPIPEDVGVIKISTGKWQASIYRNKKSHYIGLFDTKEMAIEARKQHLKENFSS